MVPYQKKLEETESCMRGEGSFKLGAFLYDCTGRNQKKDLYGTVISAGRKKMFRQYREGDTRDARGRRPAVPGAFFSVSFLMIVIPLQIRKLKKYYG